MNATEAMRALLSAAGITFGCLGKYSTRITVGDLSWLVEDNLDGTADATAYNTNMTPDEVVRIITEREPTAHVLTVCDDDGVGHSRCSACGRPVGELFKFCPWCGAKFTTIERKYKP